MLTVIRHWNKAQVDLEGQSHPYIDYNMIDIFLGGTVHDPSLLFLINIANKHSFSWVIHCMTDSSIHLD